MVPLANTPSDPGLFIKPGADGSRRDQRRRRHQGRQGGAKQYDAGFTPQGAITAMQKAISDDICSVVGLPVPDQVLAVRPLLDRAKIPLLFLGGGYAAAYTGNPQKGASQWSFRVGPPSELTVKAGVQYAIKNLNARTLGAVLRDDAAKSTNEQAAKDGATEAGGQLTVSRTNPSNSTDVTTQILAMKGVNAVVTTEYQPGIVAVLKAVQQQGMNIPTIVGQTGMQVFLQKLAPDLVKTMYSAAPCNLADPSSDRAKKWVTDFQAKYSFMPDPNAATAYDAFYLSTRRRTRRPASRATTCSPLWRASSTRTASACATRPTTSTSCRAPRWSWLRPGEIPKTVGTFDFAE